MKEVGFVVLDTPRVTWEDLALGWLREEYAADRMDLEEYEEKVAIALSGEDAAADIVPMGGLPAPDTGRRETR